MQFHQFTSIILLVALTAPVSGAADEVQPATPMRVGMIGLDTSHCIAFTRLLNDSSAKNHIPGARVVLVYPKGSPDIASSVSRVPQYTEDITALGVEVIDDLHAMIDQVDAVLLETNDGRPHLEQVVPVLKAGKPVFIDKPIAGSLADCLAIFQLAEHYETPIFSSSSLRYGRAVQEIRGGAIGEVTGCDAYSPCALEPTHPDLFWYGIHGCESLFTVMGPGCESVVRTQTANTELVTGVWADGRIGTFRGLRSGKQGYGGTAFGTKATMALSGYEGYHPLLQQVITFFQTRKSPVAAEETIDLYTFMEAADESKRRGFVPVKTAEVRAAAMQQASKIVAEVLARQTAAQ
jgi:predicted dehydrogenase